MNGNPAKKVLSWIVYLLAAFGVFSLVYFAKQVYLPCIIYDNPYCESPYEQIQNELLKASPIVYKVRDSSKPVSGFCENEEVKKLLSDIPPQFLADCKDTEKSFTIMVWHPEKWKREGWCADGLGHLTSTKITIQDGIECK